MISMIAAVALNGAIGYKNQLLYWLPNDLKRFKSLTTGNTIIMGRRTFESLPKGALPNRRNIVLTKNAHFIAPGAEVYPTLEEALTACQKAKSEQKVNSEGQKSEQKVNEEIFIIGGASVYRAAMPFADRLCLTIVDDCPEKADAFFPEFDKNKWNVILDEAHPADERHEHAYRFVTYERIPETIISLNERTQ